MAQARKLSAKAIVTDIKAGVGDDELIQKYGLTKHKLRALYKKLLSMNAISQADLDLRPSTAVAAPVTGLQHAPTIQESPPVAPPRPSRMQARDTVLMEPPEFAKSTPKAETINLSF